MYWCYQTVCSWTAAAATTTITIIIIIYVFIYFKNILIPLVEGAIINNFATSLLPFTCMCSALGSMVWMNEGDATISFSLSSRVHDNCCYPFEANKINNLSLAYAPSSACDLLLVLWFDWMKEIHHSHYLLDFMIAALSLLMSNDYFALEKGVHIDKLWAVDKFKCLLIEIDIGRRKSNGRCEGCEKLKIFLWCLGNTSVLSYHLLVLVMVLFRWLPMKSGHTIPVVVISLWAFKSACILFEGKLWLHMGTLPSIQFASCPCDIFMIVNT